MEAVRITASTSHAIIRGMVEATKNARGFKNESKIYRLRLTTLKRRLEAVKTISDAYTVQDNAIISEEQDTSLALIIADVQRTLSKAQQDATRISRLQWAIYKRDSCYRNIADIDGLVADLERVAGSRR